MKIERPWVAEGDFTEILVHESKDWKKLRDHLDNLTEEERLKAAAKYLQSRYGKEKE